MEPEKKHYRFINNQTGYAIAYFSIPVNITTQECEAALDKRRKELAIEHGVYFGTIYWEVDKK